MQIKKTWSTGTRGTFTCDALFFTRKVKEEIVKLEREERDREEGMMKKKRIQKGEADDSESKINRYNL